jgi:MFS transporter, DHA2 family, multidrug resistance protein
MSVVASTALPTEKGELTGFVLVAITLILATANFLALLDLTIANVLVPHIAGALASSPSDGIWVITGYGMAEAITVPLTGWLAERFGPVRVFIFGLFGFGVFSLLCGLAPSLDVLIFFRVALGVCGGPLIPLSQTLLLKLVPKQHATTALTVWALTSILAPALGPVIGGLIGDNLSWQWAFYFKVPLAFVLAFFAWRILAPHEARTTKAPIDFVGLMLLVIWVGALQFMLGNGQDMDWFSSNLIVALCVITVVGFIAFIMWEMTDKEPIVNLRIFTNRAFSVSMLVIALAFGAIFGCIVLVPLWLQTNLGYTSTWAGYNSAYLGIASVFVTPLVAFLMARMDHRIIVSLGLFTGTAACLMLASFNDQVSFWQLVWPQLFLGASMMLIMIPLMDMSVSSLPPEDTAAGAGQFNFIRTLARALFSAALVAFWNNQITTDGAALAGGLQRPQGFLRTAAASGLGPHRALSILNLMVQDQSVTLATNHTFLILAVIMLATAAIIWIAPKPVKSAGGIALGH